VHAVHRAELRAAEQRCARLEKSLATSRDEARVAARTDREQLAAAEEQLAVAHARVKELDTRLSSAEAAYYQVDRARRWCSVGLCSCGRTIAVTGGHVVNARVCLAHLPWAGCTLSSVGAPLALTGRCLPDAHARL
jgi:hypothetical protein